MTIKISTNTLTLSCYTRKEFRAQPTYGMGGASALVDLIRKSPFFAVLCSLTARDRRLAIASYGSVK